MLHSSAYQGSCGHDTCRKVGADTRRAVPVGSVAIVVIRVDTPNVACARFECVHLDCQRVGLAELLGTRAVAHETLHDLSGRLSRNGKAVLRTEAWLAWSAASVPAGQ